MIVMLYYRRKTILRQTCSKSKECLPVFGNSYVPSFFQHAFPGNLASRAVMSAGIVQTTHPAAKGPISSRVTENVEIVELIYSTKEDLESVKLSLV